MSKEESIANRILSVRQAWGWSQDKMAYVLGVNQAAIRNHETGDEE